MCNYVTTVASLRSLSPVTDEFVLVSGYHGCGDGGGGAFYWDPITTEPDNGGTLISPASSPASGRWKRIFSGHLSVRWFGARGDGTASDSKAFKNALDAYGAKGGTVVVPDGVYLLDEDLIIPDNCGIRGSLTAWKQAQPSESLATGSHGALMISPSASVVMNQNSVVEQLTLIRKGLVIGEPDSSLFSGTAIKSINTEEKGSNSGVVKSVQILGFDTAIDFRYHHRAHLEKISGDNVNGIRVDTSYDVMSIEDIHFWPYVTNPYVNERFAASGFKCLDLTPNHRGGKGIWLLGQNDMAQVSNVFTFGYYRGIFINAGDDFKKGIGGATFTSCHTDGTKKLANSVGIFILGFANHAAFNGCSSYSNTEGYHILAGGGDSVVFVNCRAVANTDYGFNVERGTVRLIGCNIFMGGAPEADTCHPPALLPDQRTIFGVNVGPTNAHGFVTDCVFSGIPRPNTGGSHINTYDGGTVIKRDNVFN
jgi:hypothetical protein